MTKPNPEPLIRVGGPPAEAFPKGTAEIAADVFTRAERRRAERAERKQRRAKLLAARREAMRTIKRARLLAEAEARQVLKA